MGDVELVDRWLNKRTKFTAQTPGLFRVEVNRRWLHRSTEDKISWVREVLTDLDERGKK